MENYQKEISFFSVLHCLHFKHSLDFSRNKHCEWEGKGAGMQGEEPEVIRSQSQSWPRPAVSVGATVALWCCHQLYWNGQVHFDQTLHVDFFRKGRSVGLGSSLQLRHIVKVLKMMTSHSQWWITALSQKEPSVYCRRLWFLCIFKNKPYLKCLCRGFNYIPQRC